MMYSVRINRLQLPSKPLQYSQGLNDIEGPTHPHPAHADVSDTEADTKWSSLWIFSQAFIKQTIRLPDQTC